jgi:3-dehydroquinate synthase
LVARVSVAASTPYEVFVGRDPDLGEALAGAAEPGVGVVVTDSNAGPAHSEAVIRALRDLGWTVAGVVEVVAGEASKSLATYESVLRELARLGLDREATLFALGGGVVGDLGGFAAHTYMRGIRLVQLPTSLLAMVDSSVGGKVGLDLPEGKNLVGGFLQPAAVIADTAWLDTLPDRELSCGLAEVIKMGLLAGGDYYRALELLPAALERDPEALEALILHAVGFKARVVAEDEREGGLRAILNYGHTVGHALEAAAGYELLHGEAVALGMLAAAELSYRRYGADLRSEHRRLLRAANLPEDLPELDAESVLEAMRRDKKRRSGEHRFVLLREVGEPEWGVKVEEPEVLEVLERV